MRARLKKFVLGGLAVLVVVPSAAAAEEWVRYRSTGDKPARSVFLIDRDTIEKDRSEPLTVRMAILSESGLRWVPQVITEIVINCAEGEGRITRGEARDEQGELLRAVEGDAYGGALNDNPQGNEILGIVCEGSWPATAVSFPNLSLTQIYSEAFRRTEGP